MNSTMQCLVEPGDKVHVNDGIEPYPDDPERLMELAKGGRLSKDVLANLLAIDSRKAFLHACAAIEKKYTEDCTAMNDPCLEAGCAVEGEICLQPLLSAGTEYHKSCAAEWMTLFADPRHRISGSKR